MPSTSATTSAARPAAPLRRYAAAIVLACVVASPSFVRAQEAPRVADVWASMIDSSTSVPQGRADRPRPFARFSASAVGMLDSLVSRARGQLGTRYVLGGEKPGKALDCSSFARYVMSAVGVSLPRTAAQQARLGTAVPRDRDRLRPGDLLTFRRGRRVGHVGIYLGEGRFIHASPSSGRVIETTFDRNPSLLRRWTGARRLVALDDSARSR